MTQWKERQFICQRQVTEMESDDDAVENARTDDGQRHRYSLQGPALPPLPVSQPDNGIAAGTFGHRQRLPSEHSTATGIRPEPAPLPRLRERPDRGCRQSRTSSSGSYTYATTSSLGLVKHFQTYAREVASYSGAEIRLTGHRHWQQRRLPAQGIQGNRFPHDRSRSRCGDRSPSHDRGRRNSCRILHTQTRTQDQEHGTAPLHDHRE